MTEQKQEMEQIRKHLNLDPGDSCREYKGYFLVFFSKHNFGNVLDSDGFRRGWLGSQEIDRSNVFSRLEAIVDHPDFVSSRFHQEILPSGELTWHGKKSNLAQG